MDNDTALASAGATSYVQPALMSFGAGCERVAAALRAYGSKRQGNMWQCPAHDDRHPSLSVSQGEGKALLHCFAGCDTETIVKALGLSWADLFDDSPAGQVEQVCATTERIALTLTGRTALTDRDVLLAVVKLARDHGTLCVICASRVISELSGVHHDTAIRSLRRLAGLRRLHYEGKATGGASRYSLAHNPTVFTTETCASTSSRGNTVGNRAAVSEQAAQWAPTEQGVMHGKRGTMLWCALTDDPMTEQELADETGIPRSTVNRWLRGKLGRLGYAIKTPDGWVRGYHAYDPDKDTFADPIVANRKARHQRDREQIARVRKAREYKLSLPAPDDATPERETGQETGPCVICGQPAISGRGFLCSRACAVKYDTPVPAGEFQGRGIEYVMALKAREAA